MTISGFKDVEKSTSPSYSRTRKDQEINIFSDYTTAVFQLPQGFKNSGKKRFPYEVEKSIFAFFQDLKVDIDRTSLSKFLIPANPVKLESPQGDTLWCQAYYSYPQGLKKNFKEWFFNTPTLILQIVKDKN